MAEASRKRTKPGSKLLVPQALDRVKPGRFLRRIKAEQNSYAGREHAANRKNSGRELCRHLEESLDKNGGDETG
jgi:hypothetical protein